MKKIAVLFFSVVLLSGCASYKFQRGHKPYDKGFVVFRDGGAILEYTVGKNNTVPAELEVAKQRFQRRRKAVEYYYHKIGSLEHPLKAAFCDQPVMIAKIIAVVFRLPFIAYSDYRYQHNHRYRQRVDRIQRDRDLRQQARREKLKEELDSYILKDLAPEQAMASAATMEIMKLEEEAAPASPSGPAQQKQETPVIEKSPPRAARLVKKEKAIPQTAAAEPVKSAPKDLKAQAAPAQPRAIIVARPQKGYSPLSVNFYGSRSYSPGARIIAYSWDFGDGDTSIQRNPRNTYYSTSYGPKYFKVTLTVTDTRGSTATADTTIQVLNK